VNKWLPFALVPIVLGSLCLAPCLPHDLHQLQLRREYRTLLHPAPGRVLASEADMGLLEGNGNHCDYFVGELRTTRLTREELRASYVKEVEVEWLEHPVTAPSYVSSPRDRLLLAASRATPRQGESLYIVALVEQQQAGLDFRCH
jgi:hypothetical protein